MEKFSSRTVSKRCESRSGYKLGYKAGGAATPPTSPYFHVEVNFTKGFVHIIDSEAKFDSQFGRSI
ncbi:hypothetical protein ABBQ38_012360 [Trebouxia sp. C0009 RCD-2024]